MSHEYFNKLNYTLANEDTELEYNILPENSSHVLAIAGSGSRVLPLFAKNPKTISICDYSFEQLALTHLRIRTVSELSYQDFLSFWGYKNLTNEKRKELFFKLEMDQTYKSCLEKIFESLSWESPLYAGKYERMLQKFQGLIHRVLGEHINHLKKVDTQEEFKKYLNFKFPHLRWKILVSILGNSILFNAFLYKGNHPKKNIKASYRSYYFNIFRSLFEFIIPKDSFFLQMIFFGKIEFLQGAPFETNEKIFYKMKEGIRDCKINYYQGDIFSSLKKIQTPISFLSFSDILSYFPESIEKDYMQTIKDKLSTKGITVNRYYLRIHQHLNLYGYTDRTQDYLELIKKEKTQFYNIQIYEKE